MGEFIDFVVREGDTVRQLAVEHLLWLVCVPVAIAVGVGVPTGIGLTRWEKGAAAVMGVASVIQTIPSLALLGFLIPLVGISKPNAVIALFLYSLLPIIRNTYTGIKEVNPALVEAGTGMGMSDLQRLRLVELPLALPVIMAGIRTATVICVGIGTLAALIGAGGLGDLIMRGISMDSTTRILAGAIPAALLALLLDFLLGRAEVWLVPSAVRRAQDAG
jgi:osmoprotectant transport system permease protein